LALVLALVFAGFFAGVFLAGADFSVVFGFDADLVLWAPLEAAVFALLAGAFFAGAFAGFADLAADFLAVAVTFLAVEVAAATLFLAGFCLGFWAFLAGSSAFTEVRSAGGVRDALEDTNYLSYQGCWARQSPLSSSAAVLIVACPQEFPRFPPTKRRSGVPERCATTRSPVLSEPSAPS
jgi:hypothetical protein